MSFVTTAIRGVMSPEKSSASLPAAGSFQESKEIDMIFPKEQELELCSIDQEIVLVQQQDEGEAQKIVLTPGRAKKLGTHLIQLANTIEKRGRK